MRLNDPQTENRTMQGSTVPSALKATSTGRALGLFCALTGLLAAGAGFGGCGDPRAPLTTVGTNVVEKDVFQGSWYMTEQVIDFDYDAAGLGFVGEISTDGTSGGYAMVRIRWVIDEQVLYAFRDYQTVGDAADPYREPEEGFLGQPIAAYRILSHFDIRRAYNPTSGEEFNQIVENTVDRRWWERRFMRVDWSRNLLAGWYGTSSEAREVFGAIRREPTDAFVQNVSEFPEDWRPQFTYMSCNGPDDTSESCRENDRLWALDYDGPSATNPRGELYSINFVTQQLWSPVGPFCGDNALFSGAPECATVLTSIRTSFLRVSDRREYVPSNYDDTLFDRAGYFRLERDTYDGTADASDAAFGLTDFRNQAIFRHNIWVNWVDESGNAVPYADRGVRRMVWHTSRELPTHLIRPAFEVGSEWNAMFMNAVRVRQGRSAPVYPRVDCQTDDPAGYCFCEGGPGPDGTRGTGDDVILNPTCDGVYNPFETPAEALARDVVDPYDCYVVSSDADGSFEPDLNNPALSEADFARWVNARMEGSECVVEVRVNGCNAVAVAENGGSTDGLECQERGDIRFNLLSYVDQPGTPFLGVAQFRADPVTGELLTTDANIGGPALNSTRTRALQAFDLISGRYTDQEFFTGEDIRAYLEYAGRVDLPAPPRIDFNVALASGLEGDPAISEEIRNRMAAIMERAETLQGPEGRARTFDRLEMLRGTDIERRLLDNVETRVMAGENSIDPSSDLSEDELIDLASPFRGNFEEMVVEASELETRMNALGIHMPNEFTDDSVLWYVNRVQGAGWSRVRVEFDLSRRLYRQTEIHEMGHCVGLRHDFSASADTGNYAPDYYLISEAIPLPDPRTFDDDSDGSLDYDEQQAYEAAYTTARRNRELSGIDAWMSSSIMEYTANWYQRIQGAGYHDNMAVGLGYASLVDVYDRGESPSVPVADVNPANTPRVYATYYMGGESCSTDADCPYSATGAMASELTSVNLDGGLTQNCIPNPRRAGASVCSNYDADAEALLDGASASTRYVPVVYRYCEDYRAGTRSLPYCNTFDEGDSFREMVRNSMEAYERNYIFGAFRRYRRTYGIQGYIQGLLRYLLPMVNIEQNLMYRYQFDPDFRNDTGPFGFEDEFLATADILNFFARIMASPGIGSYAYNRDWEEYRRTSQDPEAPGANLRIRLGQGRFFSSVYQAGLTGINRIERIGSFFDKIITMQMLSLRGLAPFYGPDTVFYTNFYDLFPVEMNQLFTGMIADEAAAYMPRIRCGGGTFPACTDPQLVYMDFYRGDCLTPGSTTCRPNPAEVTYNRPELNVVNGGDSFLLQSYATIYGLSEFPIYYDTTFESQMFLCIEGTADCTAPSSSAVEGTDFVRHTSARFGLSYLAWRLDPSGRNEESIAFAMVSEAGRAARIALILRDLRGDFGGLPFAEANLDAAQLAELVDYEYEIPRNSSLLIDGDRVSSEIERLQGRAEDLESFFNYVVQLQRQFGIVSPPIYVRPEL